MKTRQILLLLGAYIHVSMTSTTFDPKLTVLSCTLNKLVVNVTGAADNGIIYVQGEDEKCRFDTSQSVTEYRFDFDQCNIQWEMIIRVIIQQKKSYQTGNDKRIPVLCVADTSDLVASNIIDAQKEDNSGLNLTTRPEVTMKFFKALADEEVSGREIKLSDKLILSLQLGSQYTADFDIKAKYCVASGITLINNYCTTDAELFPNFWKYKQGHLLSEFGAFRPTTLEAGAVLINFTCIIKLCQGYCMPSVCDGVHNGYGRKKRTLDDQDKSDTLIVDAHDKIHTLSMGKYSSRVKRQSPVNDLLDVGRTIKVVEEYSSIKVLDESELCWDKFILIMIIGLLGSGFIAAMTYGIYLSIKLHNNKVMIHNLKRLSEDDKLWKRKLTAMDHLNLNRGNSVRVNNC